MVRGGKWICGDRGELVQIDHKIRIIEALRQCDGRRLPQCPSQLTRDRDCWAAEGLDCTYRLLSMSCFVDEA